MQIAPGMQALGLALYLEKHKTLVISDVHIGYEEALNKQGVLIPRFQFKDTITRMQHILDAVPKPERIVISGDVKHEFGTISEQEWRETLQFLDLLAAHCREVVLVRGNHDTILGPIAKKRNVKIASQYALGSVLIHHGHRVPDNAEFKKAKTLVIGHEHPAVSLHEGARAETFKCFLKGTWKSKQLIVLPSMNAVTTGTDVLREKPLSPFLRQRLDEFDVFVVGDAAYHFGKVKELR